MTNSDQQHAAPASTPAAPQTVPTTNSTDVSMARPTIVSILYLLNFVTGFSAIVGLILSYVWRGEHETQEWERTHYSYHIRTFWITLLLSVGMGIIFFVAIVAAAIATDATGEQASPWVLVAFLVSGLIWLLVAVWFTTRCILSMIKAGNRSPMPRPKTWLF